MSHSIKVWNLKRRCVVESSNFLANSNGSVSPAGTQYLQLVSEVGTVLWAWDLPL